MNRVLLVAFLSLAVLAASSFSIRDQLKPEPLHEAKYDNSTFSNINQIDTVHFNLSLTFNFTAKAIDGYIWILLEALENNVDEAILDIWDLDIKGVYDINMTDLDFEIKNPNPIIGQALHIKIPSLSKGERTYVGVHYTTEALIAGSWLEPEQTAGNKQPYFFTQCQSIYCRNLAPLQDTPAVKSQYFVETRTVEGLKSRVSGNLTYEGNHYGIIVTRFEMTIPVESYLLAVAVGDLAEKKIGDRTYVITEPCMLEAAATELEELEDNLIKAENYLTPYEWGEYKILILPPSFPFGGMENPLLTFASPSIIVGDKSSVDVATHEIAHSWTGNLVTNMNWNNFWLNEGFTVFTERKVTKMTEGEVAYKVAAKLGNYSMVEAMEGYGWNHSYSSLTPIMHGANPDDSYSVIPYEKGFQFVTYLESLVGEDKFQGFYREYINEFRRKSITVDDLKASFTRFVSKEFSYTEAHEILHQIDWDTWILEPGLPPVTLDFETQEFNDAVALASKYINGSVTEEDIKAYEGYFVTLKGIFLSQLLQSQASLSKEIITKIDSDLKISQELNDELLYLWFQIAIASGYDQSPYSAEKEFLKSIGRLKYIQPVYQILQTVSPDTAISFYHEICEMYHPIAQDFLEKALETSKCGQSVRMETQ